jgi:outer membrane protein assembly factor BamB
MKNRFISACLFATASTLLADSNWPGWRGPLGNGISPDADPPTEWSEERNVRWKATVPGRGSSTPVVWKDLVFLLTAVPVGEPKAAAAPPPEAKPEPTGPGGGGRRRGGGGGMSEKPTQEQRFTVLALDRATGKPRWEKGVRTQMPHEGHHKDHGFASASPVTDGEVLIASFGSFGIYALDLKGQVLWEKDLGDMQTRNGFGEGSSPALSGDTVVVLWDHEGSDFIVALDRKSGKELWRRNRDEPTGWCTPYIIEHGGKKQVVVNATERIRSYDLATGEQIWECGGQTMNAIPTAVSGFGRVYVTSGFRGSAIQAITLGRTGDLTGTDAIAWSRSKNTPYVPSPLLYGDHVYLYSGNNALLSILDAKTGDVQVDATRLAGLTGVYASPAGAAERVYLVGRDGGTLVLKNGPKVDILATNKLDDGFDASPAFAGKDLFLRGRQSLYCLATSATR